MSSLTIMLVLVSSILVYSMHTVHFWSEQPKCLIYAVLITSYYISKGSFYLSLIFPSHHRSTKTHPGPVVHLSDSPKDEGKVSGQIKQNTSTPGFPQAPALTLPRSTTERLAPFSPTSLLLLNLSSS